ncbi:MAG: hypothetical protein R3F47_08320 [Gammaproteobacteria bacterium]
MMNENKARLELIALAKKYLQADPELPKLINVINDKTRPGLPVRGILESMREHRTIDISDKDKDIIDELLYLYG